MCQVQDPLTIKKVMPGLLDRVSTVVLDSYSQAVREGRECTPLWHSRNNLILQVIDILAESKKVKKKIFLNYPYNVYQTRRESAAKDILNVLSFMKKSQPELCTKKIEQIHKEFKVSPSIVYSSIFQVYIREMHPSEFFIIEVPYLISAVNVSRA